MTPYHRRASPLFVCGVATGIVLALALFEKSTPLLIDSQGSLLAEQVSDLTSLTVDLIDLIDYSERRLDESLAELRVILDTLAIQRSTAPKGSNEDRFGVSVDNKKTKSIQATDLAMAVQEALEVRGISPDANPIISAAVKQANENYRAAATQALEAMQTLSVEHSQRIPTLNRITAIRVEQQKGAVEALSYVLDNYLKN